MNVNDLPDKVTVRLDSADKLNLQKALREKIIPGYNPSTADAYRHALRMLVTPLAAVTDVNRRSQSQRQRRSRR